MKRIVHGPVNRTNNVGKVVHPERFERPTLRFVVCRTLTIFIYTIPDIASLQLYHTALWMNLVRQ